MKGVLPWLGLSWEYTEIFILFLAALVGPVQNIFSSSCTISIQLSPSPSKLGTVLLGRLSLSMCLWLRLSALCMPVTYTLIQTLQHVPKISFPSNTIAAKSVSCHMEKFGFIQFFRHEPSFSKQFHLTLKDFLFNSRYCSLKFNVALSFGKSKIFPSR